MGPTLDRGQRSTEKPSAYPGWSWACRCVPRCSSETAGESVSASPQLWHTVLSDRKEATVGGGGQLEV